MSSSIKTCRPKSTYTQFSDVRSVKSSQYLSQRALSAAIEFSLITIHPNPGPGGRDKTEEGKKARNERRYEKRKQKREARNKTKDEKKQDLRIATWNVQRMSLGTMSKRKARAVATYAEREKWDAVLLSEVRAEGAGTVWLGEAENLTAITYTKKAAILLRGELLKSWCEGGQMTRRGERTISVRIEKLVLVSTYLPVFKGNNAQEVEGAREEIKEQSKWAGREDVLLIGGDFNAHVGGGEEQPGVCGRFGLRETNACWTGAMNKI